ncbi:MAG: undecaprenyl/decaprenyl-phosphate alpha-N-acetylglucosaminyl 1-phosphate transferase [Planctomycetes bacterium]|nr:undecaprenyl/decaprenyl-phosphate alpha-N-acetylglucosaminyl 1-phosphate transferase [Planctomycetota bacterium]
MKLIGLAIFAVSFLLTLILTPIVRKLAPRLGLVDRPAERKMHAEPMPMGGGIAIFVGVATPILIGLLVTLFLAMGLAPPGAPEIVREQLPLLKAAVPKVAALLIGGAVIFTIGILDDRKGLGVPVRFAIEIAAALLLVLCGMNITLFIENPIVCALITIAWVVGITNAFNFLDNMDGLSTGTALILSCIFFVVAVQTQQFFVAALLLTIIGATAAFLLFNFPPAKIFMGDAGALFIGYMLAAAAVVFTFYVEGSPLFPVCVPLLVFCVPLFDAISVIAIRLHEGRSPFQADKKHFSHRLVALGMTPRQAVLTIYLITFATGITATLLYRTSTTGALIILIQVLAVMAVIVLLEKAAGGKTS